ncbi:flagellar basal body rod protein FlgF [Edwardsiella piscicida]|uniref:flagellar basal body rod protein FlgF n=1 Tax=Edwardsiella piscicida TaxID=1263550 RepID=UPI00370DBDDF
MDHAIYTAMGAASQTLNQQAIAANNMANSTTPGFRAQLAALRAVPVDGESVETRTLVTASTPMHDLSMGKLDYTERPLDVALQQDGWLAVQMPDGAEAYTRNGNLQINPQGMLTSQGHLVMGDNGPIAIPDRAQLTIAADGTITALGAGDQPNATTQVGRLKLVKASAQEVVHGDDGMFHLTPEAEQKRGAQLPLDPTVKVMPGVLEGSNVQPVEAMVNMITNARRFEMQMKVIRSVDDNEQKANQLLSLS